MSRIDSNKYILDLDNNSEKIKQKIKIYIIVYPTIEEYVAVTSVAQNIPCLISQDTNAQQSIKTVNTFRLRDLNLINSNYNI